MDSISDTAPGNAGENLISRQLERPQVNEMVTMDSPDMQTSNNQIQVLSDQVVNVFLRTSNRNPLSVTSSLSFCRDNAEANNMAFVSVPGDGSCQYFAVLERLKALGRTPMSNVRELRRRVHEEILTNRDRYEPFRDLTVTPFATYARGILHKQWGDEITLKVMASILRINIEVIRFDSNGQNIYRIRNENVDYRNTIF
jgi:OTU-like cysteine protease